MKILKIILMSMVFFIMQGLQAKDINSTELIVTTSSEFEPQTDDKLNPELLNTLPAVNILNLSGKDCDGLVIKRFMIHTLPNSNAGILYFEDAKTEVTLSQYLSIEEANGLRFDPNENFEGNATFIYSSVDINNVVDSSPAIVTLPIVAVENNDEINTTVDHVLHDANCGCKGYETSIPSLSIFASLLMCMLSILIVSRVKRKAI
jgi:hypothetical protein